MHFHKNILLLFYLLFCFSQKSFSQSLKNPAFIDVSLGTGKIIQNYKTFPDHKQNYVASFSIGSQLNGTKPWHAYYDFPRASFQLFYGSLGNKKVLGNIAGLLYELSFEKKLNDKFYLQAVPAFGLAYFNKPYDEVNNPENILIGSHVTFCAALKINARYYFNPYWSTTAFFSVYHGSNSHYKLPNVGINLPMFGLGVRYHINPVSILFGKKDLIPDKKIHTSFRVALGLNEQGASTFPVNGPRYPIYLGALYATKYFTPVNKLHAGFEGWYNTGVFDFISSQDFYDEKLHTRSTAFQVVIGHEFLFGHFSLFTNGGVYLYNPFYREVLKRENIDDTKNKLKTWITARLGFQYYFRDATLYTRKNRFIGCYIKTNFGQADFLETSLGYCF